MVTSQAAKCANATILYTTDKNYLLSYFYQRKSHEKLSLLFKNTLIQANSWLKKYDQKLHHVKYDYEKLQKKVFLIFNSFYGIMVANPGICGYFLWK